MQNGVLIIGAGPVGLTMAGELTRYGVPLRIVDKSAARTDKSKALVVWSRTLELLERLGCAASFEATGRLVVGGEIFSGGRKIGNLTFDDVETPYPGALMIPQSETERLLEEHLAGQGVSVEREVEMTGLTAGPDGVTANLQAHDGTEETVAAQYLIGCDGAHSAVRHGLGMAFVGDTLLTDWILADLHLTGLTTPTDLISVYWHRKGVLVLFPITPGRYRVIADIGEVSDGKALRSDPTLAEVQAILDERGPGGVRAQDPVWLSAFRINERKVEDYSAGRVFLAGDAAHVHSPAGGQGMNTGMQDAFNLAWKLALVCDGKARPEPLLGSYSVERSEIGRQVLKAAGRATTLAVLQNPVLQMVRNHLASVVLGFAPVRHAMAETATELSIGYPDSPLTHAAAHVGKAPKAGQRMPVASGDVPFGGGDTPRFAIFGEGEMPAWFRSQFSGIVEPSLRTAKGDGLIVVRPDGYVGLTAAKGDWNAAADYLSTIAA